jgi:hypothetical protein
MCKHLGYYTPTSRYDRYRRELRFILICDDCGTGLDEVTKVPYEPQFAPFDDNCPQLPARPVSR